MTEVALLAGVGSNEQADINASLPVNLEYVPLSSGISRGYLHAAPGVTPFGGIGGTDKAGIVWNDTHYRVMGVTLVTVAQDGTITGVANLGGNSAHARLDYSFDRLMINFGFRLYYWDGTTLTQVTDPDLGQCVDALWMAGYFVSTDGKSIVVTQLADPTAIDPLKYAGADDDPDPIIGLLKHHGQLVVFGGSTVQFFSNTGGSGFPFSVNTNATVATGCVGRRAKSLYGDGFAWVGSRRNQQLGVWYSEGGDPQKLSTRIVDDMLAAEPSGATIEVEERSDRNEQRLYVHLSDRTLVYLRTASDAAQTRVWYVAYAGRAMSARYRPRHPVLAHGNWIVGDADGNGLGLIDSGTATVFGDAAGWQFDTPFAYSEAKGGLFHQLELTGMVGLGGPAAIFLSQTFDGETWTEERAAQAIPSGGRQARVMWRPHRRFNSYVGLRIRGDSDAIASIVRLDAEVEPLSV